MKYNEFISKAFPLELKLSEDNKSVLWKINRWLGIREAYLFYLMGFSANLLSLLRVILSIIGVTLIFWNNSLVLSVTGFFLIIWQVNLDFSDGALARVSNNYTEIGDFLDGLANDLCRFLMIVLIGMLSGKDWVLLVSIITAYILIVFVSRTFELVRKNRLTDGWVLKIVRYSISVIMMNVLLPFIVVLISITNKFNSTVLMVILSYYALLAAAWVLISFRDLGAGE
jgi:phosphatidylglycerophosphate synthase